MRLREGKERELQEQYEVARWICFNMMKLSPNIKDINKPQTLRSYALFPWERPTEEEYERMKALCGVTEEQAAALNKMFEETK